MRKNLTLLFFIVFIPRLVWSQYYISLSKENTSHYGNSYLIDVPRSTHGNLFIQDPKQLVPLNIYRQILFNLDTLFITQKTLLWKKNHFNVNALQKTPVLYFSSEYNLEESNDTLKELDQRFVQYKKIDKETSSIKRDSVLIYYDEGYGSSCCPRDPKYDKIPISNFIEEFEKRNDVKIGKVFVATKGGDEGEHALYFTLSGLTAVQKLKFIEERRISLLSEKNIQDLNQKYLYIPVWIGLLETENNQNKDAIFQSAKLDLDYTSPDTMPQFPGGMDAFLAQFKSIKPDPNEEDYDSKTLITFVVRRDGNISDGKVLRTNKQKEVKQIERIISESPKWIPGKNKDKVVSVRYTFYIQTK